MNILGIIAEYNPFHNGHAYQIERARALSGCDFVVAAMGGAFSQRGDPMCLDKWARTRMALACGVDVVIELPALFAVRPAQKFALGGVRLLAGVGANAISFGCESDDIALLGRLAGILREEPEPLTLLIRENLDAGKSHAQARGDALAAFAGVSRELIASPNLSLALEYLGENARLPAPLAVYPVKRQVGYHDLALSSLASATAVRAAWALGDREKALSAMPPQTHQLMASAGFADARALDVLLVDTIRTKSDRELAQLPEAGEGLDRLLRKAAMQAGSRAELLGAMKSRRYTRARLNRLLTSALFGWSEGFLAAHPTPEYARVLGFRRSAQPALRFMKECGSLPLITDPVQLREHPIFSAERRATDLQNYCLPSGGGAGRDFTERMIIL